MRTAAAALKKKSFSARAIHGNTGSNPAVANLDSRRRPSLGCYSNSSAEAAEDARKAEKQRKGSGAGNRFADRFADDRWAAFLTPTPAFTLTPTPAFTLTPTPAFTLTLTPAFTLTLTPTPTPAQPCAGRGPISRRATSPTCRSPASQHRSSGATPPRDACAHAAQAGTLRPGYSDPLAAAPPPGRCGAPAADPNPNPKPPNHYPHDPYPHDPYPHRSGRTAAAASSCRAFSLMMHRRHRPASAGEPRGASGPGWASSHP